LPNHIRRLNYMNLPKFVPPHYVPREEFIFHQIQNDEPQVFQDIDHPNKGVLFQDMTNFEQNPSLVFTRKQKYSQFESKKFSDRKSFPESKSKKWTNKPSRYLEVPKTKVSSFHQKHI